ncbi:pyridoxamine 5'-phosphate oxidase family protein [Brachyspira hyodysenteriae]|uniref:pyridoxamine 5'-phosphate oxidase family protein n=1 Tax=Brachyspira hyodysenteriae TaxID=159 RepID=UPI00063DD21C|nr:pyridoxamine 5'-phosphate oxidase family protein [Brachyspira hyodysenteriae]KLI29795.1 5-nitroimidazole antibiotic resistance protein [Brachyspira hyodysenteriae]
MFREMRRKKQLLSNSDSISILKKCTSGVLAVSGDDDYPYTVPLSYVYDDNKIFFHAAKSGYKLDAIKNNNKVSFCVIEKDDIKPEEYTTYYRSVIVFGRAFIIEDDNIKRGAIEKLALKYYPDDIKENRDKAINNGYNALCIIELDIEYMTGKEAIELINKKENK